jgi:outer membrane protein OmpA-like peptidoglycan-associated protein
MKFILIAMLAVGLSLSSASAQDKDIAGAADHAAVGRYDGSVITFHERKDYAEIRMPVRGLERADRETPTAWQEEFAGQVTSIGYAGPAGRSALEIVRNYEQALQGRGFAIRFLCNGEEECSPGRMIPTFWEAAKGAVRMPNQWGSSTYLLAEKDDSEGRLTVAIYAIELKATVNRPLMPYVAVTVVQGKAMETDKIAVLAASEMEKALARDGRIAIYGIYFDFDKAELKAESQPQIDQLATLLNDNPVLSVLVVGHTDGQGAFDYNLTLSQRRAQAVTDALIADHGISASRVTPAGAGMVAPVATNRTEEGRSKNRRVEIVELPGGG